MSGSEDPNDPYVRYMNKLLLDQEMEKYEAYRRQTQYDSPFTFLPFPTLAKFFGFVFVVWISYQSLRSLPDILAALASVLIGVLAIFSFGRALAGLVLAWLGFGLLGRFLPLWAIIIPAFLLGASSKEMLFAWKDKKLLILGVVLLSAFICTVGAIQGFLGWFL